MTEEEELAHLKAPSTDPEQKQVDYWGQRTERAELEIVRLRSALYKIISLDHHNHGPESRATTLARNALSGRIVVR